MAGLVTEHLVNARRREASRPATELIGLLESIGDPTLTVALSYAAIAAMQEIGECAEVLPLAQRVIDLADGRPTEGNLIVGSPLAIATAMRGTARACLRIAGWKDDYQRAVAMAHAFAFDPNPITLAAVMWNTYVIAIPCGMLLPDLTVLRETAEFLARAEQSSDDLTVDMARLARGVTLIYQDRRDRQGGIGLLAKVSAAKRFANVTLVANVLTAMERGRLGDIDEAIELARLVFADLFASGKSIWSALATAVLVEALLRRGLDTDLREAQDAIGTLASLPTDAGFMLHEIWLLRLRALLAQAHGDEDGYRKLRDSYRQTSKSLGFEAHMEWAEAMP